MITPFVVSVSDRYLWALKPFAYLFTKYIGTECQVTVAGYTPPTFELPNNFNFYSIAIPQYDRDKWVDGMMKFLHQYEQQYFVLMLEDYWLCRSADTRGIDSLYRLMTTSPDVVRIDLTGDRLYAGGMRDIGYYERFDLVEAPNSPYQMSLQAGIWNKYHLMSILEKLSPNQHSAWDLELEGTTILNCTTARVFGTRQWLLRYVNGRNNSKDSETNYVGFTDFDREAVQQLVEAPWK